MTKDEAINLVEQVVRNYLGTEQDHINLRAAMDKIKSLVEIDIQGTPPGAITPDSAKKAAKKPAKPQKGK